MLRLLHRGLGEDAQCFLLRIKQGLRGKELLTFRLKKKNGVGTHLLRDAWGLFGKEAQHCQREERGASLSLTSSVYICQVTTLINYQLRHSVINSWLIRSWSYQNLVNNKNSLLKVYQ